ncbi:MAG: MBOAT family protein [Selenomonas sp.]|uniref:MBOAT family O-acyltransferase n=1 Tax=Selenomonas sp. TaxID=2053611 RepID=UPI0025CDCC5F|nr:MBOAT family O-acyltransferase [Selenomonas sp.]MCR5438409.1 MBOAT family protein [Selenomonas sp.]
MVFSSNIFLFVFLPMVLLLYYNPFSKSRKFRNVLLLIASLFFYGWGEPFFIWLMILSIITGWQIGLRITAATTPQKRKLWLSLGAAFHLGMLFVFKYLTFTANQLGLLLQKDFSALQLALPIGISFFTFQLLSYLLDIYYGKAPAQRNVLHVGLYIALFPQLIAGPIVRYADIEREILHRQETRQDFTAGMIRFSYGLAKKVLLANYLAVIAMNSQFLAGQEPLSVAAAWLGAIAYTLQIYFDFSGYSDMAIGLGQMFGFHFRENFNYPYISRSVTEFWRRWHISLSSWFRDYVYIPLGGNRCSRSRMALNLLIVWSLTGFWHGANWTFLLWGLIYFLLLILEKFTNFIDHLGIFSHLYTLLAVITAWVVFQFPDLEQSLSYLSMMWGQAGNPLFDELAAHFLTSGWLIWLMGLAFSLPLYPWIAAHWRCWHSVAEPCLAAILFVLSLIATVAGNYNPFIYFNF